LYLPFDTERVPAGATGVLTIDLGALARNWRALAALVAPAECAAVVKADAYGLGAARVVPALSAAGCRTFFVATVSEALQVRALAPAAAIYVLDGLLPGSAAALGSIAARPVLSSPDQAYEWAAVSASARPLQGRGGEEEGGCALQLETGLNRLGLGESDLRQLIGDGDLVGRLDVRLVMSHLACADEPGHAMNAAQLSRFRELSALLPAAPRSLAASDGLMLGKAYHFDLVRPGYALYGGQAFKGGPTPVAPVVAVHARVLQVHDVPAGERVGYSATWSCNGPRRIATIAAGYADGFFRRLSSASDTVGGAVVIHGQRCEVAGRVSMDLITVDVTTVESPPVARGDWAELIGPHVAIEELGSRAGTIGYEVLTSLGRRFHRVYVGGDHG
jgi:alanine racemase